MRNVIRGAVVLMVAIFAFLLPVLGDSAASKKSNFKQKVYSKVDHSKFPILKQNFQRPEDVTRACLTCHNLTGKEFMMTSHWKWSRKTNNMPGHKGKTIEYGKKNAINNFCISIQGNEPRCTSCHAGYGWKNKKFDFNNQNKIDCLVCHEQTGTYKKFPAGAGYPVLNGKKFFKGNKKWYFKPDYNKVAQSVGKPTRKNCGTCHFFGGGGNNVKHGDLDKSLIKPTKEVDIHMAANGANMQCVDCHETSKHDIKGQIYSVSSENKDRVDCVTCHTKKPHTQKLFVENYKNRDKDFYKDSLVKMKKPENSFIHNLLDKHYSKIACQTCHISEYALKYKTKIWWDWSKSGQRTKDGKLKVVKDEHGHLIYHAKKGQFKLGKNLKPEYLWFDGTVGHLLPGDKIDPSNQPIILNPIGGICGEGKSKIWPFKVMRGKQIYDPVNKTFILPKLFGKKGSGAYWADFNWKKSAEAGMKNAGLPFSGKIGWIETKMYWPLNHMVRDKSHVLECNDCHSRNGRLAKLEACWIPGRDRNLFLDIVGFLLIIGAFMGVVIHGFLRYAISTKKI